MKRHDLSALRAIWRGDSGVALEASDYAAIDASAETIKRALASGAAVYGVNTGFGLLAATRIEDDKLDALQRNLVLSIALAWGRRFQITSCGSRSR